jgi:hypothetical protein
MQSIHSIELAAAVEALGQLAIAVTELADELGYPPPPDVVFGATGCRRWAARIHQRSDQARLTAKQVRDAIAATADRT